MKICFVARFDPDDKTSFSGIYYQMFNALKQFHETEYIGAIQFSYTDTLTINLKKVWYKYIKKVRYNIHNKQYAQMLAKYAAQLLKNRNFDLLFAPAASEMIAYLHTKIPILYLSDTTFQSLINYYPKFYNIHKKIIAEGNSNEKIALEKAWKIVLTSKWAAGSAINFYGIAEKKISIIFFGANLLYEPQKNELKTTVGNVCNLLFIGVDWVRKGGDLALKVYHELKNKGIPCRLNIIGCVPPKDAFVEQENDVEVIPFLNKNKERDFKILFGHLQQADFLLLPTRADCTPVVFSEAACFGLPVLTTDTGGISSVITNGINGFMFPLSATETEYALMIESLLNNTDEYTALRNRCRAEYENRLNWKTWVNDLNAVIKEA